MKKLELLVIFVMMLCSAFIGGFGTIIYSEYINKKKGLDVSKIVANKIIISSEKTSAKLELGLSDENKPFIKLLNVDNEVVADFGIHEDNKPTIKFGKSSNSDVIPAEFGIDKLGKPFMFLKNPTNNGWGYYGFTEDNEPANKLASSRGDILHLHSTPSGTGLKLTNKNGVDLAFIGYDDDVSQVMLHNQHMGFLSGIAANKNGNFISFFNKDSQEQILMGLLVNNIPIFSILDDASKPAFSISSIGENKKNFALQFFDKYGTPRILLGIGEKGKPLVNLYDENGQPTRP